MSEQNPPAEGSIPPPPPPPAAAPPPPPAAPPAPAYAAPPAYGAPPPGYAPESYGPGPIGKVRGTGLWILLFVVTLGIAGLVWWYLVHEEMKKHTGRGMGGVLALVIAFLISPVMAFVTPDEVGKLYESRGQEKPVSALTGLWYFPFGILLIPLIVWFVKTNGAINDYWKSLGAPA